MKMVKSLLLGAVAGLMAMSFASAATLSDKAKPAHFAQTTGYLSPSTYNTMKHLSGGAFGYVKDINVGAIKKDYFGSGAALYANSWPAALGTYKFDTGSMILDPGTGTLKSHLVSTVANSRFDVGAPFSIETGG